jgi:adenosine deaminase
MTQAIDAPLADLHRHLDGSIRPSTLWELARRANRVPPPDLQAPRPESLRAFLRRFDFVLSLLQGPAEVGRVAAEICEDAFAEGVSTLEVRLSPQLHRGAAPEAIVEAALEGVNGRAGLILCGLLGDPPAVVDSLVSIARARRGVVGLDFAHGPDSDGRCAMGDYAPAFRRAADLGLGRTVHAAEGRPPEEIRTAIEALGAQRIGHATTLLEDPAVLSLVVERQITVEACPSSNVQTGAVASLERHPLPRWLRAGVRACICTDNTFFTDITAREEHRRAAAIPGMDGAALEQAVRFGHQAAFQRA